MDLTQEELAALVSAARDRADSYFDQTQRCEEYEIAYWNNLGKLWENLVQKLSAEAAKQENK